jgi:hypothetical protein
MNFRALVKVIRIKCDFQTTSPPSESSLRQWTPQPKTTSPLKGSRNNNFPFWDADPSRLAALRKLEI